MKEKIERYKAKAEVFLKNNIRSFIVDYNDDWYFCYILLIGEDYIYVQHFKGNKKLEKARIVWADIKKFVEYKEKSLGGRE